MYATNARLRNHIANIAPTMQQAVYELQEMLDIEPTTANLRTLSIKLGQITFIPDESKPTS